MLEKLFQSIQIIGSPVLEVQIQALCTFNFFAKFLVIFIFSLSEEGISWEPKWKKRIKLF